MPLFKYDTVNIGSIKAGAQKISVFWEFEELKRKDIAIYQDNGKMSYAVEKNCSCQGEIMVSDTGLLLQYNDKGFVGPIDKTIKIFLADESKPVIIKNPKGVDEFNPELGWVVLSFKGSAV